MAAGHLTLDETKFCARRIAEASRRIRVEFSRLEDEFLAMDQMKDGDGSQAAHFALVTSLYGTGSDAMSKALYDELNSTIGNSAALKQFMAKIG